MKIFASKQKQSAPAECKTRSYVHHPMGPVQQAQQAEIHSILRSSGTQAKLTIGQPNDKYEQEADRVADQVMRMPDPKLQRQPENEEEEDTLQAKPLAGQITPLIQRQAEPEEEEEEPVQPGYDQEPEESNPIMESVPTRDAGELGGEEDEQIQTKSDIGAAPQATSGIAHAIHSIKGGGQPLPASERAFFEPRFGRDFGNVRVYSDSRAAITAHSINARAFTLGRDIVFGAEQYSPGSRKGRSLLAHELTHIVQQGGGRTSSKAQHRESIESDPIDMQQNGGASVGPKKAPTPFTLTPFTFPSKEKIGLNFLYSGGESVQHRENDGNRYQGNVVNALVDTLVVNTHLTGDRVIQRDRFKVGPYFTKGGKELTQKDIDIAVGFNYRYTWSNRHNILGHHIGLASAASTYGGGFEEQLAMGIANWQEKQGLRIDGQMGWHSLARLAWILIKKRNYSDVSDAIRLVVDGLGYRVAKIKHIVYNPKLAIAYKIVTPGKIEIGRNALKSYTTFRLALGKAVQRKRTSKRVAQLTKGMKVYTIKVANFAACPFKSSVKTIVEEAFAPAGIFRFDWDGKTTTYEDGIIFDTKSTWVQGMVGFVFLRAHTEHKICKVEGDPSTCEKAYTNTASVLGRAIANTFCHEIGHSFGLRHETALDNYLWTPALHPLFGKKGKTYKQKVLIARTLGCTRSKFTNSQIVRMIQRIKEKRKMRKKHPNVFVFD